MKKSDGFHIMVLPISKILIRIWVEFLIGQFILENTFSKWDLCGEYRQPTAQVGGA